MKTHILLEAIVVAMSVLCAIVSPDTIGILKKSHKQYPRTKNGFLDLIKHLSYIPLERKFLERNKNFRVCSPMNSATIRPLFEKEPQKWQKVDNRKVLVFSAFYESRPEADGPSVRVLACGWQAEYNAIGDLYCNLWYETRREAISMGPAKYDRIYPSTVHADMWVSHFIICKLPPLIEELPYAVTITDGFCQTASNDLLVLNREPVKEKKDHASCISPMYNSFREWEMIIEMFELHKLLGTQEIITYNFSISRETNNVMNSYIQDESENVHFIQWPFPRLKSNVFCQRGALNDCLYRLMHRYKYVSVVDFDEVLVPRSVDTWPQLLMLIGKPEYGAYLFQHAYFRRNTSFTADPYLITQTSFWRPDAVAPPGKIRCKAMYEAEKAIKIDLHFPYSLIPGSKELIVHPDDAMLHHYRPYPMETFRKHPEKFNYIEDRYFEKFNKSLTEHFVRRKKIVKESFR